jgi:tRNA pseudouridine13 synthase
VPPADVTALPLAWGCPPARGRIRVTPEDFAVDELLGFAPDGAGAHLLLRVEKRGANSGWVAAALARAGEVAVRDVGFSGHKDRNALTRQHYSLPASARVPAGGWAGFSGDGFRVLEASPHGRKLKVGTHRANRFRVVIRELAGDTEALVDRLAAIGRGGVPNYFGPQRFGRDDANLHAARAWAAGGPPPRERAARGFALSAARSLLFNTVLARRIRDGTWNDLVVGDAAILDGRRSFFAVTTIDEPLRSRCLALDVHPSGPLHGRGEAPVASDVANAERECAEQEPDLVRLLQVNGLVHERRSLRVAVRSLVWRLEAETVELEFELPRGAFATAVLHELLENAWDTDERGDE